MMPAVPLTESRRVMHLLQECRQIGQTIDCGRDAVDDIVSIALRATSDVKGDVRVLLLPQELLVPKDTVAIQPFRTCEALIGWALHRKEKKIFPELGIDKSSVLSLQ